MKCEVCGANVAELRRGRCWGCYTRWVEARPVGLGAQCTFCGDRRREYLKSVEILGAWMPACHNCTARATKMDPMPQTVADIRTVLERDRRQRARRAGKKDTRVFTRDRRNDDRREPRRRSEEDLVMIEDEMILEMDDLGKEAVPADLTRIHDSSLQQ